MCAWCEEYGVLWKLCNPSMFMVLCRVCMGLRCAQVHIFVAYVAARCSMAWSERGVRAGSRLGSVMRMSNVVTLPPEGRVSTRDTYTPLSSLRWSMVKLAIFSIFVGLLWVQWAQVSSASSLIMWRSSPKVCSGASCQKFSYCAMLSSAPGVSEITLMHAKGTLRI